MKFNYKPNLRNDSFILFRKDMENLFEFGGSDILIKKEKERTQCCCDQHSYYYQGKKNVFVGREGFNESFTAGTFKNFEITPLNFKIHPKTHHVVKWSKKWRCITKHFWNLEGKSRKKRERMEWNSGFHK